MSNGKRNHQNVESSPQILGRAALAVNSEPRDNRPQVLAPGRGKHIHSCESSYRNTVNTWSWSTRGRENIYKSVLGKSWGNQWISCWKCFHVATWGLGVSQSVRNENTGHPDIIWICACDWKSPTCLCKWPGRRQSPMAWGQSWRDGKEHKHVWMILFRTKIYMKLLNIHSMVWQGRRGITRIVCMAIFAARPGPGFRAHILFMWWGCKSFPLMCFIILSRLPLLRCDP